MRKAHPFRLLTGAKRPSPVGRKKSVDLTPSPQADPAQFEFEGRLVRTHILRGEPWFVAADVCSILGIGNTTDALSRLEPDERTLVSIEGASNGMPRNAVNESGLYALILGSRKLEAKAFRRWVTSEVLPSIRKTGRYEVAPQAPSLPRTFAEALRLAADQAEQIERQQQALAVAAPKVEFVDRYVEAKGSQTFRQVAKLLGAKEPAFRAFLAAGRVMYQIAGDWVPYAEHIEAGRFVVKTGSADNGHAFSAARFTPKGVEWISQKWRKAQEGGAA